jgi:hypothetical protein
MMAVIALLIYHLLLRFATRGGALVFAVLLSVGALSTAEGRFDLVPALLVLLCVLAAKHKRWTLAYVTLAFGVLLKIYPLMLWPALFLAEQLDAEKLSLLPTRLSAWQINRQHLYRLKQLRWQNSFLFLGLLLGVTGFFAFFNFDGAVTSQFSYFAQRPIQIESTGSSFLWLGGLFGHHAHVVQSYGSVNVASDLSSIVSSALDLLFIGSFIIALLRQWQGKLNLNNAFLILTLLFIVTGKVFSPQYLIWIFPLLANSHAWKQARLILWLAVSALTSTIFPFMYEVYHNLDYLPDVPFFIPSVAIRNGLLLIATLAILFNWWGFARKTEQAMTGLTSQNLS